HILDLLRRQYRLAGEICRDPRQALDTIVRRHDAVRIKPARVDDAKPQLAFRPAASRAGEVGGHGALELFLGERAAMAEEAKPDLPVAQNGAAARRIALLAGKR